MNNHNDLIYLCGINVEKSLKNKYWKVQNYSDKMTVCI